MNEVEAYLRESGKWRTPISTDWRGRVTSGTWWPTYYAQWLDVHQTEREERGHDFRPGGFTRDANHNEWWITDTPEWDRQWFRDQGVLPPNRFGDKTCTYWKDYGGGLLGLSYKSDDNSSPKTGFWSRLRAIIKFSGSAGVPGVER